ncbi:MAG: DUF4857 domain-containing protein [Draconibacterium sp.]|nr:DUF4857 domain-containing protein [Draconibacterium sp.]
MVKLSRYFLVVIAVIVFAIVIPKFYWMAFEKPIRVPFVIWSCIDNDFMITRTGDGLKRTSRNLEKTGETLTREAYEQKLPFLYVRQLLMNGTMPDSINGVDIDTHDVSQRRSTFRIRPKEINSPLPTLYPLFESQSGRANLEMPEDFFRITWRMEFIDAESNKINEDKSRMFSAVLYKRGFKFPAKSINGLPTTRKSCDEGYLVIDSEDQLFHIKMIEAKPFVEKIKIPNDLKFKFIKCVDFNTKLFYAYLFSTDNNLYILTQYDYELIKFPIENINPDLNEIKIYGDLLNFNVISVGDGFMKSEVLDRDYNLVDTYSETWNARNKRIEGEIAQFLFPFQIKMTNKNSGFIKFFFEKTKSINWIFMSIFLIIAHFIILKKRKVKLAKHGIDFIVIALAGIFGFIAVNFFPNKFFN